MTFALEDVQPSLTDFAELVECKWISYENPYQPFLRLFNPIFGDGSNARTESLKICTARQLKSHMSDAASHWKKITDQGSGKIIAGAWWKLYTENPFEDDDDPFEAFWYPEGGQRDFATAAAKLHDDPRTRLAHLGAAAMLMDWGIQQADEMGVEMWLEATASGVPLYRKYGFVVFSEHDLVPKKAEKDKAAGWKELETALSPMCMWLMWRPMRKAYIEGTTMKPWEHTVA